MKNNKLAIFFAILLMLGQVASAQNAKPQWTKVLSDSPETFKTKLVSSSENSIIVNVKVPGYYTTEVTTPKGEAKIISVPKSLSTANAGEPDVPMTGIPLMIGDRADMKVRVVDAKSVDFEDIEVAPSKGDFSRQIDPSTVPYTYGECYSQDAFFPAKNVDLYEPYIIRDLRGQNMAVFPFAYNPVTKTLRVYYDMTIEMYKVDDNGRNAIEGRRGNVVKMDPDFKSVYQRHFLNFEEGMAKYSPVDEEGDLLIICYDSFLNAMSDFVNWKKTRGVHTTIVGTSTISSNLTYSNLKTYIQNQYNANNNLTHVLLVGDVAQIPGYSYTGGGSSYSGKGDNPYGQIVGNDIYNDLFIGRFSASSTTHVATQVQKVITYERDMTTSDTWCQNGLGVSTSAGNGGHYNEDDYQHIENLRTDLLGYGYSIVYQDYKSVSGYPSSTTSTISNHINSGVGIINYCNHGSQTQWQSHSYSTSHVNALTNSNKLPFIFSVACLNGQYDYSSDCFAEAWMRATNNSTGAPTGAVGTLMSYISQPWIPPMWAQDEFVDILVESYSNNIKRTWGGAAINSLFAIFDNYSTSTANAVGTYQAWILYGDPTLMLRTKTPQMMNVSHAGAVAPSGGSYTVNVNNGNGAVVTITDADHNILGKSTVSNGTADVNISGILTPGTELTICVFGYNKVTYVGTINVVGGAQYTISTEVYPSDAGTVTGSGYLYESTTCTLTAIANSGYDFVEWSDGSTENPRVFTVTGDVSLTANFTTVPERQITLASVMNGTISCDHATAYKNDIITMTGTPAGGYYLDHWDVFKSDDINTIVSVDNGSFTMPDYDITVSAVFSAPQGGDVTIGSGSSSSAYIPTYSYYNYSLTQQIYTSAEVGEAGTITKIAFKVANSKSTARDIDIYLSHTSNSSFSSSSSWISQNTSYKVFSGTVDFLANGWTTITLDTPFEYNGTSNLLLTMDDNTGSYVSSSNSPKFYVYSTNRNSAIYKYYDYTNYNPASMSTSGTLLSTNNQVVFTKEVPSSEGYLSVSPTSIGGFSVVNGVASDPHSIAVIGSNLQSDLAVTAPTGYEVCATIDGTYSDVLTLTPAGGNIRTMVYVQLKADMAPGTYEGDITLVSETVLVSVSVTGEVMNTSYSFVLTEGTNWVSFNVEITLDDLKAALVEALGDTASITIKSQTQNTKYANGRWNGQLETLDVAMMYIVVVSADCEITVQGEQINLENHSVTLHNGANYIAFPFNESMSLGEFFAGFAVNGDGVKSQNKNAKYTNGRWNGQLNTLEPGHGYIYKSSTAEERTFVFPTVR